MWPKLNFSLITKRKKLSNRVKPLENETSVLVTLIKGLTYDAGFISYMTMPKMSWIAIIFTICFITACILQVIALFMAKEDPEKMFECFSILSFCGMGVFKLSSLRHNHQRWRFLLKQILKLEDEQMNNRNVSDVEYQSDNEEINNYSSYVNHYTGKFKTTYNIFRRMYHFTGAIFIVSPFLEHLFYKARGVTGLGYPHILPGWTPLDNISIFGYILTVLCEFIASVYCVYVHIAFDLTAVGVMIFVCGQFTSLYDYSAQVGGKGRSCTVSKKRNDRAEFRIRLCHRTNMLLNKSIVELDKLLKNIIGVYFFLATLTLCTVALRLKSEDMSVMQLASLLQYMCGTLTQLFLYCHFGDAVFNRVLLLFSSLLLTICLCLTTALCYLLTDSIRCVSHFVSSVGMGQGPFGAAYWCLSPRIRQQLVLLSTGMLHSRHLRAGPFNFLDLPSFIQIVRAAYSYYAVMGKKN